VSRTLNDDFDDDDLPGGSLDLEKGSAQVGAGGVSSYGGDDGIDFDDELYGDGAAAGAALELDIPGGGRSQKQPAQGPSKAPPAPPGSAGAPGGAGVPDLAFDAVPPPSSRDPARSSGAHRPHPAPAGSSPSLGPSSSSPALPPSPQSSGSLRAHGDGGGGAETSGPHSAAPHSSGQHPRTEGAPGSDPRVAAHGAPAEPAKPNYAAILGKYPAPPAKVWQAPMYTVRVIMRQLEIRSELESLRRRRSPDVPLYEAALRSYDAKSFRLGLALNIAAFTVATLIFCMPVFLRFLRND